MNGFIQMFTEGVKVKNANEREGKKTEVITFLHDCLPFCNYYEF